MKSGIALLILGLVALNEAQLFAPYKPKPNLVRPVRPLVRPTITSYSSAAKRNNEGRYDPASDGQYRSDNSGQYRNDDGRYYSDDSGKYVHIDPGYKHIEGAQGPGGPGSPGADRYRHQNDGGRYTGDDNSGRYVHKDDPYKHIEGAHGPGGPGAEKYRHNDDAGKYVHKDDPYKHILGPDGGAGPGPEKYKHVEGPQGPGSPYKHVTGPQGPSGSGKKYVAEISGKKASGKAILHKCKEVDPEGYSYGYDTEKFTVNGAEDGALQYRGTEKEAMCAIGYYNYMGDDSKEVTTYYIADEYGFRPVGDHVHPQIARMLKYLEDHVE